MPDLIKVHLRNVGEISDLDIRFRSGDIRGSVTPLSGPSACGKSTVASALSVMGCLISGQPLPDSALGLFPAWSDSAAPEISLITGCIERPATELRYRVQLGRDADGHVYPAVECLDRMCECGVQWCWMQIFQSAYEDPEPFYPLPVRRRITGRDTRVKAALSSAKALAAHRGASFLCSDDFMEVLGEQGKDEPLTKAVLELRRVRILTARPNPDGIQLPASDFPSGYDARGTFGVHIFPWSSKRAAAARGPLTARVLPGPRDERLLVAEEQFARLQKLVDGTSDLSGEFLSGHHLTLGDVVQTLDRQCRPAVWFSLFSESADGRIPAAWEAESSRRLWSLALLLLLAREEQDMCLVIDDLDFGLNPATAEKLVSSLCDCCTGSRAQIIFTCRNADALNLSRPQNIVRLSQPKGRKHA